MRTLLVLAPQPGLAEALRAVLNPEHYRIVHQSEVREADLLRSHGRVDGCVMEAELTSIRPIRIIETLRRCLPECPIVVYADDRQWEWEEEAYLLGVAQVLAKPVRARLINSFLDRLWPANGHVLERSAASRQLHEPKPSKPSEPDREPQKALEALRDFSTVLTHSLCAEALLKQFLLLLREIIGVNRAAIFLRQQPGELSHKNEGEDSHRLRLACAIGLPLDLLEHFALSLNAGVGGCVSRQGRILRREAPAVQEDPQMRQEFELLGAEVALPILDRESIMGVAFFDSRVTGEALTNEELALIFYLLEGLGMAIKNIWLHDQLSANHTMMGDILRQFNSGCIVVAKDLSILHANHVARDAFARPGRGAAPLEFSDLPQALGSKVFEVLKTGVALTPFKYRPPTGGERVYQITISPFQKQDRGVPDAALLLVEDYTQTERLQRLEIEAGNLRMIKTMGERLAHEVGNAVVPLSTHQQLFAEKYDDPEFRASLSTALTEGVKRISRLGQQMLFLAQDRTGLTDPIAVSQLIEDAFREAQKHHQEQTVYLQYETGGQSFTLTGDRAGLKHALAEVMLNAVQANPPMPKVKVSTHADTDVDGTRWVHIEIQDSGSGFTPEAARKVPQPFFTTRNVGLGLGLAVSRKIIETNRGKLKIADPRAGQSGLVTISLPLSTS
ncbi:MAG: PAS domain-containing protein [Verrucomicrobia bacterium]|nr:PAS domain-containing protein [Verrucomicrobiota bacterium]